MDEKFWTEDPTVIYRNYYQIIPNGNMSRVQQLNTCTRFLLYFIVLCLIFQVDKNVIIYLLIGIILIIVFYYIYANDPNGIENDLIKEAEKSSLKYTDEPETFNDCSKTCNDINLPMITLYDSVKNKVFKGNSIPTVNFDVESGYIDSDGNYKIGPNYSDVDLKDYIKTDKKNKEKKVTWEKDQLYKKSTCRKPTIDNPFSNIVFSDYLDAQNIAEPCNIDDTDVQNQMQNLYNSSIYRNLEDVWERENSQRMFYTVPIQTVPNSQTDFANWLYKTGPTCHENTQYCTYYEDPSMTSQRY